MSGISSFPLSHKSGRLAALLPDKFTDADVKAAYGKMGSGGPRSVAGIRDNWEEESLALQEEAAMSRPEARLDRIEERLDRIEASLATVLDRARRAQRTEGVATGQGQARGD